MKVRRSIMIPPICLNGVPLIVMLREFNSTVAPIFARPHLARTPRDMAFLRRNVPSPRLPIKYPPTNGQADPDRRAAASRFDRARGIERPAGGPLGSPGEGSRGARRRLEERNPRPARRGEALPRGLPALPAGPAEEDLPQASRVDRGPERRPRRGARSRRGQIGRAHV